jgi:hypothetical protein
MPDPPHKPKPNPPTDVDEPKNVRPPDEPTPKHPPKPLSAEHDEEADEA